MNKNAIAVLRCTFLWVLALTFLMACTDQDMDYMTVGLANSEDGQTQPSQYDSLKSVFLYNHGVGYGYNAMSGDFCDIEDVRCQVINRPMLEYYNDESDEDMLIVDYKHEWESSSSVSHSFVEYIQNTNFQAEGSANIMVVGSGKVSAMAHVFEDGTVDQYILTCRQRVAAGSYRLNLSAIKDMASRHPDLLTASFREAVEHLKECDDSNWEVRVDSFLNMYGTHVITSATLGAELKIDVQIKSTDYRTIEESGTKIEMDIIKLLDYKRATAEQYKDYKHLQDSKCIVSVLGGDVSTVDRLISMNLYQAGVVDETNIANWRKSVVFSEGNKDDNSELIDMEVAPIWELIPDQNVADLVRIRIEGSVDALIARFGNKNFINAHFTIPSGDVSYCRGGELTTVQDPDIVDVVCAGRHVAAICREWVPTISTSQKVKVVYPIYEGRIKTTSGICRHQNATYKVEWTGKELLATVIEDAANSDSDVYLLAGIPSFHEYKNITYQEAELMPEVEMSKPILPNGTFDKSCRTFSVFKHFGNFYLDSTDSIAGIQNWTYERELPEEAARYGNYIDDTYKNRMRRDDAYLYVYNPIEASVARKNKRKLKWK